MKFKKILLGFLITSLIFTPIIHAKYDTYSIEGSIDNYEFNKITEDDLKDFKFLIRRKKHDNDFLGLFSNTIHDYVREENMIYLDDVLKECDILLENKVKKFEEKFGKDEFDRPYIIFKKSNKSPDESTPNLSKEKYEKIKKISNNTDFPTYEEYVKSWIDLNTMFNFKEQVLHQAVHHAHLGSGFVFKNGNLKYYSDGIFIKNRFLNNQGLMYFNSQGNAVKNSWIKYYKDYEPNTYNWYYFNSSFMAQSGWMLYNAEWYYFNELGEMLEEKWIEYNSKWYYLKKDGTMAKNEKVGNYYVNNNGEWIK